MSEHQTQNVAILTHLQEHADGITPIEALDLYGCFRLGARILDLRKLGLNIETTLVQQGRKRFARYTLKKHE